MFGIDFYPTPEHVVELMCSDLELHGKNVLEPSAGKGNIVDYLNDNGAKVFTCEIDDNLAKLIQAKSKFIASDFLTLTKADVSHIDIIVMNPPFSKDDKHILHAFEIAPDGCEIVALCNWNTLKNTFSTSRKQMVQKIELNGTYENISKVFRDSERPTNVEIGLIKYRKPYVESEFFDYFDYELDDEENDQHAGIMPYNAVRDCVGRYIQACQLFDEMSKQAVEMNRLVGMFGVKSIAFSLTEGEKEQSVHDFKIELKKKSWKWIFDKMNMHKYMTSKLKEQINEFCEKQSAVPFTMKNIYKMFEQVVGTHDGRMKEALVQCFDNITKHHHENRYYLKGWKTNSHYMINKKFIVNHVIDQFYVKHDNKMSIRWDDYRMDDIVKALNYFTGKRHVVSLRDWSIYKCEYDYQGNFKLSVDINPNTSSKEYIREQKQFGQWYDFSFFEIKIYKLGSMHVKFKDPVVWEIFNREVANKKGFILPDKF